MSIDLFVKSYFLVGTVAPVPVSVGDFKSEYIYNTVKLTPRLSLILLERWYSITGYQSCNSESGMNYLFIIMLHFSYCIHSEQHQFQLRKLSCNFIHVEGIIGFHLVIILHPIICSHNFESYFCCVFKK